MSRTLSSNEPEAAAPRRRPVWLPVLALAAVLPLLLWLGFWQLDRAAQKRIMLEQFAGGGEAVALASVIDTAPQQLRYRRVTASGRFDAQRQFLLEGMTRDGRPGLHVLTPFTLDDDTVVIVDRGWVPETRTRDTVVELPLDTSRREIVARVVPYPEPGLRLAADAGAGWPRRVLYPTAEEIGVHLGAPVTAHLLWLDAAEADGFVRDWQPAEFGPARHIGYAVQWFGLALTVVLIYIVLRFRRR